MYANFTSTTRGKPAAPPPHWGFAFHPSHTPHHDGSWQHSQRLVEEGTDVLNSISFYLNSPGQCMCRDHLIHGGNQHRGKRQDLSSSTCPGSPSWGSPTHPGRDTSGSAVTGSEELPHSQTSPASPCVGRGWRPQSGCSCTPVLCSSAVALAPGVYHLLDVDSTVVGSSGQSAPCGLHSLCYWCHMSTAGRNQTPIFVGYLVVEYNLVVTVITSEVCSSLVKEQEDPPCEQAVPSCDTMCRCQGDMAGLSEGGALLESPDVVCSCDELDREFPEFAWVLISMDFYPFLLLLIGFALIFVWRSMKTRRKLWLLFGLISCKNR